MNSKKEITIGSIVTISKGRKHSIVDKPSEQSRRLLAIDDLRNDNQFRFTNDKKGTEARPDDVLIAWDGANAGTIGYGKSGFIGSTIARLRFKERDHYFAPYLGAFLRSKFDYLRQTATGATIPHINRKALEGISLPEIDYDDQKRIAHLLGKVEGLITRRKQHLQLLADLLKSVFQEMFGPHTSDFANWPMVEIKDLAAKQKGSIRTGPFGSNLLHGEFSSEGDVAVLGIDNAVQNCFAWGERRFISFDKYRELECYRIYSGDVIITIMGTIGRSAVIPEDIPLAINTKHLAAITLNREIANPIFLSYSIHSSPFILNQFKSKNRGAIMSGLNLGIIKETKLKRPPINLQNQFAAIVEKVESIKSQFRQNLADLEALYGALTQKAFKGELNLSQVTLPKEKTGFIDSEQQAEENMQQEKSFKPIMQGDHGVYLMLTDTYKINSGSVGAPFQRQNSDPETVEMLKMVAMNDDNSNVRQAAIQALGQMSIADPETMEMLKMVAMNDDNSNVRQAAIQALGQTGIADAETVHLLKMTAMNDENGNVRQAAIQTLGQTGVTDPETVEMLKIVAMNDGNNKVRQAAIQALKVNKDLLIQRLKVWVENLGDKPLLAQEFMNAARQRLIELYKDDGAEFGAEEYDELKTWIFKALDDGRLIQTFDDANNILQIKVLHD
jgi:type I restriction enzyme S subunit